MSSLDNGGSVRTIFVDFRKAFDLVDHNLLFDKLKNMYGIPNCLLKWIGSYLKHRQQRVRANQTTSSWKQLKGSWIGPLSFLALISDLTTGCLVHKYVDDTTLSEVLQPNANNSNMKDFMENLLNWADQNHMQLNTTKTKEMILGPLSRSQLPILSTPLGPIDRVSSFKLLGVYIETTLCWSLHVDNMIKKATKRLYFLKQLMRAGLPSNHLFHYYSTVIRPVLE